MTQNENSDFDYEIKVILASFEVIFRFFILVKAMMRTYT